MEKERKLYQILKTGMTLILLMLAYFLPGLWAKRMGQPGNEAGGGQMIEKEGRDGGTLDAFGEGTRDQEETGEKVRGKEGSRGVIVLDPGHGGEDPGMVGIGGVEEKEINLQIALILKTLLEEQGFSVILTRSGDSGLYDAGASNKKAQDMQRRCALIEAENPILTVSIHQNSYSDPSVYGPQVFYYEHSEEGKALAACIQEALNAGLEVERPRNIKANTNYYILKRSASVTVLVECAFLSNPEEAEKIQREEYQEAAARGIREGILEYLEAAKGNEG